MLLLGDEDTYIMRTADLIQMDGYAYWINKDTVTHYNIYKAYTEIHASLKAKYTPMLPLPVNAESDFFTVKREVYRRY